MEGNSSWGAASKGKSEKTPEKKSGWTASAGDDYELAETPKPQTFTDDDCEEMLKPENQLWYSSICLGAYGWDGTCKTGALMDNHKNVMMPDGLIVDDVLESHEFTDYNDHLVSFPNGRKMICYDADGSAGPIKTKYHGGHPNIIIVDPLVLSMEGMDYVGSYNKILAISQYVWKKQKELEIFAVNLDGYDKVLKWMEYVMKYKDLKVNPNVRITDSFNWGYRNQKIDLISTILKKMACETYYTTHHKEKRRYEFDVAEKKKILKTYDHAPDWIRTFPGVLFQRLEFIREHNKEERYVKFSVIIDKAKGALQLEGAEVIVAEVKNAEVKRGESGRVQVTGDWEWYGINGILNEFRKPVKVA